MKKDIDVEDALKRFRSDPGDQVKRSVLSRFKNKYGSMATADTPAAAWKKPVPLYLFAASVLLAIGLSFFAGMSFNPSPRQLDAAGDAVRLENVVDVQDLTWEEAPNDVL